MTQPNDPISPTSVAGWYPQGDAERWWDGANWTDHVRPGPGRPTGILPAAGQPYSQAPGSFQPQPYQPGYGQPAFAYPAAQPPFAVPVIQTGRGTNSAEVVIAWVFAVVTLGYMLPWAIAATRGKSNSVAIAVLNLLLGWTFIGWIIALVMACSSDQAGGNRNVNVIQVVNSPQFHQPPQQGPGQY
jgi:T4 superinfection immunity protein/uncharacterized protein DUF2510